MYGGYVLKYVGDAVLAFFVVEDNNVVDGNIILVLTKSANMTMIFTLFNMVMYWLAHIR